MNRIMTRSILIMSTLVLLTEPAFAGSMSCGTHIIVSGGSYAPGKYEVLKKCGKPTQRHGNTWIYGKPGKPQRVLQFDGSGKLENIT